jgi:hypothetical protein
MKYGKKVPFLGKFLQSEKKRLPLQTLLKNIENSLRFGLSNLV